MPFRPLLTTATNMHSEFGVHLVYNVGKHTVKSLTLIHSTYYIKSSMKYSQSSSLPESQPAKGTMRILIALFVLVTGALCNYPVHPSHQIVFTPSKPSTQELQRAGKATSDREEAALPLISQFINGTRGFAIKVAGTGKYLCARRQYYYKEAPILVEANGGSKYAQACQFKMTSAGAGSWVYLQLLRSQTFLTK